MNEAKAVYISDLPLCNYDAPITSQVSSNVVNYELSLAKLSLLSLCNYDAPITHCLGIIGLSARTSFLDDLISKNLIAFIFCL